MSILILKSILLGILGAIFGSFITMLTFRLPKSKDIVFSRSMCPACKQQLQVVDLIPVLSFLVFKGRCRQCQSSIGIRYVLSELVCMALFLLGLLFTDQLDVLKWLVFVVIGLSLAIIDFEELILPDSLTALLGTLGLGFAVFQNLLAEHLIAGLIGMGLFFLIRSVGSVVFKKEAMGIGDIKLIGALGCFWGFSSILWISYLSFLIGGVIALVFLVAKGKKQAQVIPFGPAILIAACLVAFFIEPLMVFFNQYFWQV